MIHLVSRTADSSNYVNPIANLLARGNVQLGNVSIEGLRAAYHMLISYGTTAREDCWLSFVCGQ